MRIPMRNKAEILAAVEQRSPAKIEDAKVIKIGSQVLKVRNLSSGFRVIYESAPDRNTIVSILTPREVRFARG